MRVVILTDNVSDCALRAEWGLSVYIEYEGHPLLLDTGASAAFAENADALGLDLAGVEFGVLSHAHYDHADGLEAFFARNSRAPFYLREGCREDCFGVNEEQGLHYIGIRRGVLSRWAERIVFVSGRFSPLPGVTLLPHTTPGLAALGEKARLYRETADGMTPDDFAHEQSLVFETPQGLVVFNSCCHAGADAVVREAAAAFPGRPVRAILGGFHLHRSGESEVRAFARRLRETGVELVVTGHCTGQAAFDILREELGPRVRQMKVGLTLEL